MAEVASAYVSLIPSAKGFGSKLDAQVGGDIDRSGKTSGKRFGTALKAGALAAMAGGVVAAKFLGDAVGAASDLAENQSKVGVVFGKSSAQIIKASKTSATAMGLSQNAYLGATGTLGNLLVSLDIAPQKAAGLSQKMVELAGDMASFNNVSPEEALEALKSGLTGETEPLKRFGVNMNDATLKAQALKDGLIKNTKEALTPQTKALAAQALIMDQTKTAQGDFARTSGGLANQQRILAAQVEDVKTKVGKFLLPVLTKAVTYVNKNVVPAFSKFVDQMQNGKGAGGKFVDAIGDIKDGLQNAFTAGKKLFDMFNSLPSGLKKAVGIAAGGALIASKIPGGKAATGLAAAGLKKTLLSGVQKVFVVNQGTGLGGGPGGGKPKGGKLPGLAAASPLLLPLLTSGDQGPKKLTGTQKSMSAAIAALYKGVGLDGRGGGLDKALSNLVKGDPGKAFKVISQAARTAGISVKELTGKDGFPKTAAAVKHAEREFGSFKGAAAGVAAGARRLTGEIFDTATQMNKSGLTAKQYGQKLHSLPKGIQTKITTPGAITSKADVMRLKRQFDLTPKQVRTLMQLTGVESAISSANHLRSVYAGIPRTITTQAITRHIDKFERLGGLATGTDFWRGGPTWVGERGPEILNLPRGSQVVPNHRVGEVARSGGGSAVMAGLDPQKIYDAIERGSAAGAARGMTNQSRTVAQRRRVG